MLAPDAVVIAVTNSSLIASLCFTFAEPFDDIFSSSSEVVHWSAEIQTKVYDPRIDRPTHRHKVFNRERRVKKEMCVY